MYPLKIGYLFTQFVSMFTNVNYIFTQVGEILPKLGKFDTNWVNKLPNFERIHTYPVLGNILPIFLRVYGGAPLRCCGGSGFRRTNKYMLATSLLSKPSPQQGFAPQSCLRHDYTQTTISFEPPKKKTCTGMNLNHL